MRTRVWDSARDAFWQLRKRVAASLLRFAPAPRPLLTRADIAPAHPAAPDVTVVIPVYNSADWLKDCITSVLAQTGVDVEVVCIDDGSTDGSGDVLARMSETDPRIIVATQSNSGQSVARNVGVDAASGRYIVFLDSDDFWVKNALADLVTRADDDALDVLLFDCVPFLDGDVDQQTWTWYSKYYQRSRTYRGVRTGPALMTAMRHGNDYRPHVGLYLVRR
ncbi:MAG: glycosyltransferase family 2 protein, partial [Microbacterium sp.]